MLQVLGTLPGFDVVARGPGADPLSRDGAVDVSPAGARERRAKSPPARISRASRSPCGEIVGRRMDQPVPAHGTDCRLPLVAGRVVASPGETRRIELIDGDGVD